MEKSTEAEHDGGDARREIGQGAGNIQRGQRRTSERSRMSSSSAAEKKKGSIPWTLWF
jgi:hypothetical protein